MSEEIFCMLILQIVMVPKLRLSRVVLGLGLRHELCLDHMFDFQLLKYLSGRLIQALTKQLGRYRLVFHNNFLSQINQLFL